MIQMTNEEAIKILAEAGFGITIWNTPTGYCEEDWDEALYMAIEALKYMADEERFWSEQYQDIDDYPDTDGDYISRQAAIEALQGRK